MARQSLHNFHKLRNFNKPRCLTIYISYLRDLIISNAKIKNLAIIRKMLKLVIR